ncbi:hypothetical protein BDV95DRAFT_545515 [Massariosphaeria phaeospora]|uniref:FAD-binding PCMH-type domain-containing protein n=1 Tax=Massariosphaeria phaeospora TaxID=100035 RepID=A0A7C8I9D6_9PLEO|nr:hypothetical protein BDV95DRAFT_545515 [Massariosphaeria phaeospora]
MLLSTLLLTALLTPVLAVNFEWEKIQLTEAETRNYSAIRFGGEGPVGPNVKCKIIPGDTDWPSDVEWARFNDTLGGALLKPLPLASPCYTGPLYNAARCEQLKRTWSSASLHSDDPISIMSQWASGNTCVATSNPDSTCTQGGYPVYVVNATTARHIQLAVNFARNQHIRLVIKNSGHDFNGKSIGGNSLSVWTHNLKSLTYHPSYTTSDYSGRAVALGAGIQALDGSAAMRRYNMTMIIAGGSTVGLVGGFFQGGGHSSYTSYYGLGADQVIKIHAVTADGKLVTADAEENPDLYWAFRGGGPGTYGIVTSIIVKAFPTTPITSSSISFSTVPTRPNATAISIETFWAGLREYWRFTPKISEAGGIGYNFIRHTPIPGTDSSGFTFTTSISVPNTSTAAYRAFVRPLLQSLNDVGIPLTIPADAVQRFATFPPDQPQAVTATDTDTNTPAALALGDTVSNTLIASRFFTLDNHASNTTLEAMHLAIRDFVSAGGYTFHGIDYTPSLARSGHPSNAIHPAFRRATTHAEGYASDAWWDGQTRVVPAAEQAARHTRLQAYMQKWRDITPGSGSYMNEGDAQEEGWKDAFFGSNYARLAGVKAQWDREGVFWAVGMVGSDAWEVRGSSGGGREGVVTQDGRLCRVGGA